MEIKELRVKQNRILLTERELEYLALAAQGYKNPRIAYILSVSKSTVKKTFENVFQKLFAKDRTHAVAIAFTYGILSPSIIHSISDKFKLQIFELENRFNKF